MQQPVQQLYQEGEVPLSPGAVPANDYLSIPGSCASSGPGYRFRVEPVSKGFFRIVDSRTHTVKGWRLSHWEACALARQLDSMSD